MIDPDRWERLLLSLLYEAEAQGLPHPELVAIERYARIFHRLYNPEGDSHD